MQKSEGKRGVKAQNFDVTAPCRGVLVETKPHAVEYH